MSKIALSGNASGTGVFTFASPNSNTDRTLDIPDASGTIDRLNRAGNVLQVVQATYSTSTVITSTSYTDSGLSASITPTSASSKILVLVAQQVGNYQATANVRTFEIQLLRGATQISYKYLRAYGAVGGNSYFESTLDGTHVVLDSPATTSSVTYKTQGKIDNAANSTFLDFQQGSGKSTITLMEIAA